MNQGLPIVRPRSAHPISRDAIDPETVLGELAAAAGSSLQPAHVSVWVRTSS